MRRKKCLYFLLDIFMIHTLRIESQFVHFISQNESLICVIAGGGGFVAPMLVRLAWHCSGTWCEQAKNGKVFTYINSKSITLKGKVDWTKLTVDSSYTFFPTPSGGSEGATMRFKPESDHGGNAGLGIARKLLEPIKEKHPEVSYADLYILAGIVAIEGMQYPLLWNAALSCHWWQAINQRLTWILAIKI